MLPDANFCWILPDTALSDTTTLPGHALSGLGTRALLSHRPETDKKLLRGSTCSRSHGPRIANVVLGQ
eukprot:2782093-Prorocentrum_lima.AAC.1